MGNSGIQVGILLLTTGLLAACGGGNNDNSSSVKIPIAETFPATGNYAWGFRASGQVSKVNVGLSLIHPSQTDVEYALEASGVSDVVEVQSGTVDARNARVNKIQPYGLLYIAEGVPKYVMLQANGSAPRIQTAMIKPTGGSINGYQTGMCKFLYKGNDYAAPERSRFLVSTKGIDNICGTKDDGQTEIILKSGGIDPFEYADPTNKVLGYLRDPETYSPSATILEDSYQFIANGTSTLIPTNVAVPNQTFYKQTKVVSNAADSYLVEDQSGILQAINLGKNLFAPINQKKLSTLRGGNWQEMGYDANNYFVYQNTGYSWKTYAISRSDLSSRQIASGSGSIVTTGIGTTKLYLSVVGVFNNQMLAVDKLTSTTNILETDSRTSLTSVLTSNSGVHLKWRASQSPRSSSIDIIDETGNTLFSNNSAILLSLSPSESANFKESENRSRFIFATGFSSELAFSDATLMVYDASKKTSQVLGRIPGATEYAATPVSFSVGGSSGSSNVGFANNIVNGSIPLAGGKLFSYDTNIANSLHVTSQKK